jgi:cytochrome c2
MPDDSVPRRKFLLGAKVKGTRMPYGGMSDAKDVDDDVAYLKTLK